MIKLDFHGSTHGHFLEYIANVYIMQTLPSQTSIFKPPTYSAHAPDINYLKNRQIFCGHFSNSSYKFSDSDIVIRINIDTNNDDMFFIALTNLIHKAGDVGVERQLLSMPANIKNDPVAHRNNWYSKINERHTYSNFYTNFLPITNDVFYFAFESFFCFTKFCAELTKLSNFLNQTFFPDESLYSLWSTFIKLNQGWQSYVKCEKILENIFANLNTKIECSIIEQGWLNYKLSKMCNLYTGPTFEHYEYPDNTQLIYKIIQQHLCSSK